MVPAGFQTGVQFVLPWVPSFASMSPQPAGVYRMLSLVGEAIT